MNGTAKLYANLGGSCDAKAVKWPGPEEEAEANRAARAALGRMLRSKSARDRAAARAVYARYFGVGEEGTRGLRARGLRRLRADPEVLRSILKAEPDPTTKQYLPHMAGAGWITVREAAQLTGYSEDHIRGWIARKGKVRSRKVKEMVYVNRAEVLAYARKMRARGYGPQ